MSKRYHYHRTGFERDIALSFIPNNNKKTQMYNFLLCYRKVIKKPSNMKKELFWMKVGRYTTLETGPA